MIAKYELTVDIISVGIHILHRIQALKDFSNIKAGDLGGFIESEKNLSQDGACWISENACVYETAVVYQHALAGGKAQIFNRAHVYGAARIFGNSMIYGDALVKGQARIYGDAWVCDKACVLGNSDICGDVKLFKEVILSNDVTLNSGIWDQTMKINKKWYVISTTLKKVLLEKTIRAKKI